MIKFLHKVAPRKFLYASCKRLWNKGTTTCCNCSWKYPRFLTRLLISKSGSQKQFYPARLKYHLTSRILKVIVLTQRVVWDRVVCNFSISSWQQYHELMSDKQNPWRLYIVTSLYSTRTLEHDRNRDKSTLYGKTWIFTSSLSKSTFILDYVNHNFWMSFATWNNGRAYLGLDFDQY